MKLHPIIPGELKVGIKTGWVEIRFNLYRGVVKIIKFEEAEEVNLW